VINIGCENGFLKCGKAFIGQKKKKTLIDSSDYHSEMNHKHFESWFEEVIQEIPDKSVIVVDQASYHRRVTEDTKNPSTIWRKNEIIGWLKSKNVSVPEEFGCFEQMTVPLLRTLCKSNVVKKEFVIERMVKNSGKDIKLLWIPIAHCELSPIELIWSQLKRKLNKKVKHTIQEQYIYVYIKSSIYMYISRAVYICIYILLLYGVFNFFL